MQANYYQEQQGVRLSTITEVLPETERASRARIVMGSRTDIEWNEIKDSLWDLYVVKRLTLEETMNWLASNKGFYAT